MLNGTITRNSKVRFLREGTIIWKGTVSSLRRFKDDAREVQAGFECGIGLSDFQDLQPRRHHRDVRGARDPEDLGVPHDEGDLMAKRTRTHSSTARDYPRTARLNRLFQEILAEELERVDDERLELVTIMSVDVDASLDRAIVYYESLGGADDDEEVLAGLDEVGTGCAAPSAARPA